MRGAGGDASFCRTCVYVPILITAIHHWCMIRITKGRTEGGIEKMRVLCGDFFMTSGP